MTLFWLSLCWMAGLAVSPPASLTGSQWASLAGLSLAASLLFRNRRLQRWLFVIFLTICLGAGRAQAAQPVFDEDHVSRFNNFTRPVRLTGVIIGPPDVRDSYVGLRVRTESIQVGLEEARPVHGIVLVQAERYLEWAYGDQVRATGYLRTPPDEESFSYRDYLARQGTFSLMRSRATERLRTGRANPIFQGLYELRRNLQGTVYDLFPEPEASLLSGILLGIESGISPEVRDAFNATGTTHIIAISGFNITIIAGLFLTFFGRTFGSRKGMLTAGVGILVYTLLVGADPAVVRAAIMGGLSLLALRLGRRTHGLASLGAAAVVMTAVQPATLYDVGFQLSFAATLGLILYADPLQAGFETWLKRRWTVAPSRAAALGGPVGEYFLFTLAAQVTTLPLTAFYFHRLSLASVLANPAILPAQPAVMVLGGLATLIGSLWIVPGRLIALVAWPFAAYTIRTVAWFSALPLANFSLGRISPIWIVIFYGLLFGATLTDRLPRLPKVRVPPLPTALSLVALSLGVFVIWDHVGRRPDGRLHLTILDTRGGQAVLVTSPSGRYTLINGGRSPIALEDILGHKLPPFRRDLDWLILSSSQEQDLLGLADLTDRANLGGVLADDSAGSGPAWALMRGLHQNSVPVVDLQPGTAFDLGHGARLSVVEADQSEAAIAVTMGSAGFLVTSGSRLQSLPGLSGWNLGRSPVILLRDAGAVTPQAASALRALSPLAVVVSCDSADPESLPSSALQSAFGASRLLRTDQRGTVEFSTDGERLWGDSQRQVEDPPGD
jgi:competence protein ComEC